MLIRSLKSIGCLILPLFLQAPVHAIDLPKAAIDRYTAGEFRNALPLLDAAVVKVPEDVLTRYYLANTLVKLGMNERAAEQYERVLARTTDSKLQKYCVTELSALRNARGNFAQWVSRADSQKEARNLVSIPEPAWSDLSIDDASMISFSSRCRWADRAFKDVLWALSVMPRSIKSELEIKKTTIALCSSLSDQKTAERARQLNLDNGWTWDNVFGFTSYNKVLIAQTWLNGRVIARPGKVLFHELGHAFDFTHGGLNQKPSFSSAFEKDKASLGAKKPWKRHELFAQIFALQLLALVPIEQRWEEEPPKQREIDATLHPKLKYDYPNCWAAMSEILAPYLRREENR